MAYILSKVGQSFNVPIHIYEADTEEDMNSINLQSVPMGSKCHIINDDKWYMLNSDGKWKAMPKQVQPDWNQNDKTAKDYIKNRPGGYIEGDTTFPLIINATKQDGINKLTIEFAIEDNFIYKNSINVEILNSSGTINRTLAKRHIPEYIINDLGTEIYGNAHLINATQPDTGEDLAIFYEDESHAHYNIGWHVWATSVPSGNLEIHVVEETMHAVPFSPEFMPWEASPTANSVLYTAQSLTEEEQAQARANIGAGTPYTLLQATSETIGGVKADSAEAADTQPVRIGGDGKLYTEAGGTDISLGLTSASVGQTIKVKAVDESGKPTAWEAVDIPSGGSDISLGLTAATVGQTIKVKAIDADGKPTEWQAVTPETWNFVMADGTMVTKKVYVDANE